MHRRWIALVLGFVSGSASAATLDVAVVDDHGAAVADAVVSLLPHSGLETGPGTPQTHTIDQHALQFDPYLEILRPGDSVVFHNSDRTRHHVYSFSPAKAFEEMVPPGTTTAPMKLEQPGVIAVGCNIHDGMISYLVVTDAPWVVRTGADGKAHFDPLPDGTYEVRVWQPRLRPDQRGLAQSVIVAAAAAVSLRFELALLPDQRRQSDRETLKY